MIRENLTTSIIDFIPKDASSYLINPSASDPQQFITSASGRYAVTRYPFSPHIVRFNSNKNSINQFKDDISKYYKFEHDFSLEIINCQSSNIKCSNNETYAILYLKDSSSPAFLLDHANWSSTICGETFRFPSIPPIPPLLPLIIKKC